LVRTPHRAKRRRIRTVMQELMYLAARLIYTARRIKLAFGFGCPVVPIFRRLYTHLVTHKSAELCSNCT
jgi:hypothetical protein